MSNQRDRMKAEIEQHGARLVALFPRLAARGADKAARAVHRLETAARRDAELWCNGEIEEAEYFSREARTLDRLDRLTGWRAAGVPVFVNSDPRGVALKVAGELDGGATVERFPALAGVLRDWGGDYMLAPTFTGEA